MSGLELSTKRGKGKCSICGSKNLEYGGVLVNKKELIYEVKCRDCRAVGNEWYKLRYNKTAMVSIKPLLKRMKRIKKKSN